MSLPPGFLDELRTRVSLSQVVGRKVVWDARKSNQGKGDMWAPCPFHQEKSPSFHVDDRKGFYYCFGCQAKGDAISFVKDTENVSFIEAVEILAREAGMAMPERSPRDTETSDRRTRLIEVMEQAARFFRLQLRTPAGQAARDYLAGRKRDDTTQERFGIGFAPDSRQALWTHLTGTGVAADLVVESGMAIAPDDGTAPYDRFRGRIMFPIRDARGRCIAFGGRAMDPNARAKYLNSPETPLFDKGRSLYNIGPAREAAGKGQILVVAEGYMDVIALSEAGFAATVAPLGTAITEDQLRLMWRVADEPVIALDGDAAGLRAAMRVIDVALPLLKPGKSLRFSLLPEGQDPDDLIRAQGAGAMQRCLDQARPMVALLWQRETEGKVFDSPERRASLGKTLHTAVQTILDPAIRGLYEKDLADRQRELFQPRKSARSDRPWRPFGRPVQPVEPMDATRRSLLATSDGVEDHLREAVILAVLSLHPKLVVRFETSVEAIAFSTPDHRRLALCLVRYSHLDAAELALKVREVEGDTLEKLLKLSHVHVQPPVRDAGDIDKAERCLTEEFAKLDARRGVRKEIEDAVEDLDGLPDEGLMWRLGQAVDAVERAHRPQLNGTTDLGEDTGAMSRHLQSLLDNEVWVKKRR